MAKLKKISLKEFTSQDGREYTYSDMLQLILRIPAQGADYEQMRRGVELLNAIDDADDELFLTPAQYREVCEKVKAHKWGQIDPAFMAFMDDILDAEDVEQGD